jgi:hypothetical protein
MKTKLIILLLSIFSYAQAYTYDPCPYADDIVVATIIMEAGGEYKHGLRSYNESSQKKKDDSC